MILMWQRMGIGGQQRQLGILCHGSIAVEVIVVIGTSSASASEFRLAIITSGRMNSREQGVVTWG
jgi:hypothetical protein